MSPSPDKGNLPASDKLRVLVVDDEPTLRLGFAYALSNKNTVVETAPNGRQALERLADSKFDIMILDLRMPELDGIGVIEALRGQGNEIPIVLCSAALSPNAALRAIRHGVVDFLLKPVRPVDLRQVIEFVRNPEKRPLPLAMKAARQRETTEAIRILENDATPSRQAAYWLSVLQSIRDADPAEDGSRLEEKVRTSLSILAFNAPTVS
ncbi:MAG: response regulator [Verrucomicrobiota bacterium]